MGWQTKKMEEFSREELLSLIETLAKNWLALDGVWFQAVEKSYGLEAALEMDYQAWRRYSGLETKRLMNWLGLPEGEGIIGLRQVLQIRPQSRVNRFEIMTPDDNTLIYCLKECRVQAARKRAGLPDHPCKPVGIAEYEELARAVDPRLTVRCMFCPPDPHPEGYWCAWEFKLEE